MPQDNPQFSKLLEAIVEHLNISESYYEKAAARHRSLAKWLQRKESKVAIFDPDIRPQGSFRYGTVTPPFGRKVEYDLDNVCLLKKLNKSSQTQEQVMLLYGEEIASYAKENSMLATPQKKHRCWRLRYADEVKFHLDTLPCVSEDPSVVQRILAAGVLLELANRAVAITDDRDPRYREITSIWPSSNPRGFARWFEGRAALGRSDATRRPNIRGIIEDVPPYEWKTTLQLSIQILKRHRDVMFFETPELAPISMIITCLAAHAYSGEASLSDALTNIVEKMPSFIGEVWPRVPNPSNPFEDYADKWAHNPHLVSNFWAWHAAVKSDVRNLSFGIERDRLKSDVATIFKVDLTDDEVRRFGRASPISITVGAPLVRVAGEKPWGHGKRFSFK